MDTTNIALVADDNPLNSGLLRQFLKRMQWSAVVAATGPEALQVLRTQPVRIVLLDLRMPRMSGEQVCATIRGELGLVDLPVVAYTAHAMPEEKARILAAGFNGLLIKPVSFQDTRRLFEELGLVAPVAA